MEGLPLPTVWQSHDFLDISTSHLTLSGQSLPWQMATAKILLLRRKETMMYLFMPWFIHPDFFCSFTEPDSGAKSKVVLECLKSMGFSCQLKIRVIP